MSINSVIILSIILYFILINLINICAYLLQNEPINLDENKDDNIIKTIDNVHYQYVIRQRKRAGSL
jgi:hypothetical protein